MLFKHSHHSIVTIARLMNVLDGYRQCYRLVDEPSRFENTFVLINGDDIIFLVVFASKLHHQTEVGLDGLVHHV